MAAASQLDPVPSGKKPPGFGVVSPPRHVARPKSAKGRTRPPLPSPCAEEPPRGGGQSTPDPRVLPVGVPALLRSPSSLNKYRVLPSIGRNSGAEPVAGAEKGEPVGGEPRLLLAVRSPSGRRFERHFRPSDSLATVLAVAAQRNSSTYRHHILRTAEVPPRTFPDLSRSLQECGVPHKSLLCILRPEEP
ncbi:UBX domain-containing protein 10 isoform X2 [Anolis carolinensis]